MTFRQSHGLERTWVPQDAEEVSIRFWTRRGVPAVRWKDYLAWGRSFFPPHPESVGDVMCYPKAREAQRRRRKRLR